ncbi:MAG: NAD(P)H-hydrate dehydratase, partial [Gemmatimonadaceae bacterium]
LAGSDALLVGPGLGRSAATRALVEGLLVAWRGPVVLDADALNVFEGDADALGALLVGRPALVTPHPAEFARLAGGSVRDAVEERYEAAPALARRLGACVLLKGVPTLLAAPDGRVLVSAAGTPALAVAGSGDLLSGVCVTLLAQMDDALAAAACAAWAHGRAGERALESRPPRIDDRGVADRGGLLVRGATLDDVLAALGGAWSEPERRAPYPVLGDLPAVGERRGTRA